MKNQKRYRKRKKRKLYYGIPVILLLGILLIFPPARTLTLRLSASAYEGAGVLPELLALLEPKDSMSNGSAEITAGTAAETAVEEMTEEALANASTEEALANASISSAQNSYGDWRLLLVNRDHPIPENYEVTLTQLQNQQAVDSRIYPDLQAMFDDARNQGILPMISSSYRTARKQQELMEEKIAEYRADGYDEATAVELAEKWVAISGTSEHQTGICVDITTADANAQEAWVVWDWLKQNSYKYGFIQRYPEDKTEITGIINEPWHYRYVGKEAAAEIYGQGICLEEYLEYLGKR